MQKIDFNKIKTLKSKEVREYIRNNHYTHHTAGLAQYKLQANVVILPKEYSDDFLNFCKKNKKSCPLIAKTEIGNPYFCTLGNDIDIRSDVPSYNIYQSGKLIKISNNIENLWENNLVAFAIGCSFTFEHEIIKNNLVIDHIVKNKIVPMYKTKITNERSGIFSSNMVVSMRIFNELNIDKIVKISRKFDFAHGQPVHIGNFEDIGIKDIFNPDWGDPPRIKNNNEEYFFWACGVTPQNAVMEAKLPFCITHTPGHMLITDINEKNVKMFDFK